MQRKLFTITNWINENPNRIRVVAMTITGAMAVAALLFPEAAAFANPEASGGSTY